MKVFVSLAAALAWSSAAAVLAVAVAAPAHAQVAGASLRGTVKAEGGVSEVTAVNVNTTRTDQRTGLSGRYVTTGQVRAGAMLLRRAAPELVAGYTRYYLTQADQPTTGDVDARLASVFPLPQQIVDAIDRQLEVVLGGI